jgi:hypothetical protein
MEMKKSPVSETVIDWQNDPFFQAVGILESKPGDLSENHDTYIYGKRKPAGKIGDFILSSKIKELPQMKETRLFI